MFILDVFMPPASLTADNENGSNQEKPLCILLSLFMIQWLLTNHVFTNMAPLTRLPH